MWRNARRQINPLDYILMTITYIIWFSVYANDNIITTLYLHDIMVDEAGVHAAVAVI